MVYVIQTALELGFMYALVAMALFLSYRILDIADLTTDSGFVLGAVLKKKDKARANHYKYYTDQEWGMASNYDLCLNSGLIGIEGCVKALQQVLELTE